MSDIEDGWLSRPPVDIEQGKRAVTYYGEQLWEASRGLASAYAADTGDTEGTDIPAWSTLTEVQRRAFVQLVMPARRAIFRCVKIVEAIS